MNRRASRARGAAKHDQKHSKKGIRAENHEKFTQIKHINKNT
jgi:hypothetical protein